MADPLAVTPVGGTVTLVGEIVSKALTIASSPGGLAWLADHVRNNIEFQAKLDATIAAAQPFPPPSEPKG